MVENFYVHKTKSIGTIQVKRKQGRPPKPKPENLNSNSSSMTAANTHAARPYKMIKIPSNDIVSRELVSKINAECEKSDRLTVAKLNTVSKPYKQDYKSKLMTEKYSLLPINPQQLTPGQTALQKMSEKHPDFEIQAVNTIRPPDKIVKSIETRMIHGLELPIQAQDLIKAYQTSAHF